MQMKKDLLLGIVTGMFFLVLSSGSTQAGMGDVDGSKSVGLEDAILSLKAAAGDDTAGIYATESVAAGSEPYQKQRLRTIPAAT
jgi:hypothetical protein